MAAIWKSQFPKDRETSKRREGAEGPQQRLLGDFQGLFPVAGQPGGQGQQPAPVGGDQRLEGLGAAGENHGDELLLRLVHPHGYTRARAETLRTAPERGRPSRLVQARIGLAADVDEVLDLMEDLEHAVDLLVGVGGHVARPQQRHPGRDGRRQGDVGVDPGLEEDLPGLQGLHHVADDDGDDGRLGRRRCCSPCPAARS
ncbi:MAG: hypothetical protein MZV64_34055 [Ignavibacteriales bacterium]|nr:hypothetical protein [Ignavibacteriales bacterium]